MARTLKSTGIATSLDFLACVDDDNATPVVFKSVNSSAVDNTAAVNGDMTIGSSLSVATMTWNGHTVPYMKNDVDYAWLAFGTNKPYLKSTGGGVGTYFWIGRTPSALATHNAFGGTASAAPTICITFGGGHWYSALLQTAGNFVAYSTVDTTSTSGDETWAFVHDSTGGNTCRYYKGSAGSSIAQNNTNVSDPWNISGALDYAGGTDSTLNWSAGRLIMVGKFTGEISSTDLGTLHADPFGTLFDASAAVASTKQLLTLGVG